MLIIWSRIKYYLYNRLTFRLIYSFLKYNYKKLINMNINLLKFVFSALLIIPMTLQGQVTIDDSTFPVPGDTLRTVTSFNFDGFDKEMTGEDLFWGLTNVSGGFLTETIYIEPTEGVASDLFPDADLLDNSTLQEIYYQTLDDRIVEIGRAGLDPVLNLIDLTFENEGENLLRRAPMSFGDSFMNESSFRIQVPGSEIPDTLLDLLPIVPDSMRLIVEELDEDVVDAWGTVEIPGGTYEVIRVKRTTTTNVQLAAKVPVLNWLVVDPANPLFAGLGPLLDLLGETVEMSYAFVANDNKEIIASFAENEEGELVSMTYKGDVTTSVGKINLKEEDILTYPNPTFGDVTFKLVNLPHDNYKVVVYNILGKQLWSSDIDFFEGKLVADLSHLRKGTYFYSVINGQGQKVATRRLMIITP